MDWAATAVRQDRWGDWDCRIDTIPWYGDLWGCYRVDFRDDSRCERRSLPHRLNGLCYRRVNRAGWDQ